MTNKAEQLAQQLKERHGSNVLTSQAAAFIRKQAEANKLALEALEAGWSTKYTGKDARALGEAVIKLLREVQG